MMSKYQSHQNYTGIENVFLDSIPTHWEVKPLYALCKFQQGKAHEPFVDDEGEFICVNSRFVSTEGGKIKYCTENLTPAKLQDILMVMSDLPNGRALAKGYFVKDERKYAVNQRVCVITAQKVNAKFLYYQMDRNPYFLMYDDGANQTHLSNAAYLKYPVLLPPAEEQLTIAAFLDYETARIDQLIAKQKQLIELLKEKRQAVISHAVTKGLNPNVPMKDSGVEWLGQVPEHWVVTQLRHLLCHLEQGKSPECEARMAEGEEWGVLKTGCVNGGVYRATEHKALPVHIAPHKAYEVRAGDLLMSRASGSRDLIGAVAYIDKTPPRLLLSDKVFRLILVSGVHPQYLSLLMGSKSVRSQIELAINGAEGLANNITKESIKSFLVACPDYEEQLQIHKYLSEQLNQFDSLEAKLTEALVLLQERRTALISAAVTGKIDLRGWQPPKSEVAA